MMPAPLFFGGLVFFLIDLFARPRCHCFSSFSSSRMKISSTVTPQIFASVSRLPARLLQREKAAGRLGRGGRDGQRPGGDQAVRGRSASSQLSYHFFWNLVSYTEPFFSGLSRWGFLPAMAVCIVWGAGQTVYSYWCLKLGKPGGTSSPM